MVSDFPSEFLLLCGIAPRGESERPWVHLAIIVLLIDDPPFFNGCFREFGYGLRKWWIDEARPVIGTPMFYCQSRGTLSDVCQAPVGLFSPGLLL